MLKLKANAYSFLEVLKKINNQETVSFEDLKKAHAKAQLATGLSSPQLQLLHLKIVSVQPVYDKLLSILLQSPDSGSEITALLAEFHNLKVEPPEQYRQYNHQKALLNELYIYYIKH